VERDAIRMCELLVGLPEVHVLGVDPGPPLLIEVETTARVVGCALCGSIAVGKGRRVVELVDLPAFGCSTRLRWRKRRWRCPERGSPRRCPRRRGARD